MSFEATSGDTQETKHKDSYPCRKCKGINVYYQIWESSCGGFEDYKHTCPDCGAIRWEDGIDS